MSSNNKHQIIQAIMIELRRVSANSVLISHVVAEKVGIHSTDNECLDFLMLEGSATAGRLSEITGLTTGSITAMIDRLEKAGYVKRQYDKEDRRKVIVVPNVEKVEREINPHMTSLGEAASQLMQQYPAKDLSLLLDFLKKANELITGEIKKLR